MYQAYGGWVPQRVGRLRTVRGKAPRKKVVDRLLDILSVWQKYFLLFDRYIRVLRKKH